MTDIQKWKKIPEGTHKVIDGKDMVRRNGEWVPAQMNVRNSPRGKEYNIEGTDRWSSVNDGSDKGEIAGEMDPNTVNRDVIAGDLRPDKPTPDKRRGTNLGENFINKPWQYDSPLAYFKAYAMSKPKTKLGKYLFNTVNTLTWLDAWYKNNHPETPQTKAIDQGYEDAIKNIDQWLGSIDPKKEIDSITSKDLAYAHKQLKDTLDKMEPQYKNALGKNDPESIRLKTEYKTYRKLYDRFESDINRRRSYADAKDRARALQSNSNLRSRVNPK